jgi:hypothetical protein
MRPDTVPQDSSTAQDSSKPRLWKLLGLALLLAVVAVAFAAFWLTNQRVGFLTPPSDRTWMGCTFVFTPYTSEEGTDIGLHVAASCPNGTSPDLWIRYSLGLRQQGTYKPLVSSSTPLDDFLRTGTGSSDYTASLNRLDPQLPYHAIFDYEIWKGKPGKGELLAKNTVLSDQIIKGRLAKQ